MWMDMKEDPRFTEGTDVDGERDTMLGYLRGYRLTLEMKCEGLDAEQLARRSVPPSTMSLLGLVRHMADVERNWFRRVMAQTDAPPLYWSDDIPDADWAGATADPAVVAEAWLAWRDEIAFADEYIAGADDLGVRSPMSRRQHGGAARRDHPHDRGVRQALRPRRPAARAHRRPRRPVTPPATIYFCRRRREVAAARHVRPSRVRRQRHVRRWRQVRRQAR